MCATLSLLVEIMFRRFGKHRSSFGSRFYLLNICIKGECDCDNKTLLHGKR